MLFNILVQNCNRTTHIHIHSTSSRLTQYKVILLSTRLAMLKGTSEMSGGQLYYSDSWLKNGNYWVFLLVVDLFGSALQHASPGGALPSPNGQVRVMVGSRLCPKPDTPVQGHAPAPSNTRHPNSGPCKATGKHLPFAAIFDAYHPVLAARMALCNTLHPWTTRHISISKSLLRKNGKNHTIQLKSSFSSTWHPKGSIQHKQEPEPSTQPHPPDPA